MIPNYNYQEYQVTVPQFYKHLVLQGAICPDILGNTKGEYGFGQA